MKSRTERNIEFLLEQVNKLADAGLKVSVQVEKNRQQIAELDGNWQLFGGGEPAPSLPVWVFEEVTLNYGGEEHKHTFAHLEPEPDLRDILGRG